MSNKVVFTLGETDRVTFLPSGFSYQFTDGLQDFFEKVNWSLKDKNAERWQDECIEVGRLFQMNGTKVALTAEGFDVYITERLFLRIDRDGVERFLDGEPNFMMWEEVGDVEVPHHLADK